MRTSDESTPKGANWNRFSMLDGMVLIAASAVGMGLVSPAWGSRLRFWVLAAFLAGVIAGPMTLVSQRLRGRRAKLGPGEYFWLSPLLLFLITMLVLSFTSEDVGFGFLKVPLLAQCVLSLAAACRFIAGLVTKRPNVGCRWTDSLGSLTCALAAPAFLL